MFTFIKLFFESPEQVALSLLFVFILWYQRALLKLLPVLIKVYPMILLVSFWLITKQGSGSYMPLFMPFMLIIIFELYKLNPFNNWGLKIILLTYFIIGIYGTLEIIYENYTLGSFPTAYKNLRKYIPKKSTGLVPLTFFFNEYEQYSHLLSHENFTYYSSSPKEFSIWANKHNVDFILMDYKYRREAFYPEPGTPNLPFYHLNYFNGRFSIYTKL